MLCVFCESSSSNTTRKHIIYLASKLPIPMRYFLLFCTILILQVFMPSGRILAAAPPTAQISPISYAAIQPIEPTRTKKRFRLHKKQFIPKKAEIHGPLTIIFTLVLLIYAILPLGAILGITWLWITALSIHLALSLYISFFIEIGASAEMKGTATGLFGFFHLLAFLIAFLITVFFLYNSLLFLIASAFIFVSVVLAIIIRA
jgi:hypothetical protein